MKDFDRSNPLLMITHKHIFAPVSYHAFHEHLWRWKSEGKISNIRVNPWPHMSHLHMADILGYFSIHEMQTNWRKDSDELLRKLNGPHGWTIYNIRLAQLKDEK